jgi:hypothetical protein
VGVWHRALREARADGDGAAGSEHRIDDRRNVRAPLLGDEREPLQAAPRWQQ